ncbi:metabotropic glutamate receptor 3-like [Amphiura filiformis]|uniref:metabotropic glutamate receptor 3-like n=1 Tax=Amphiura filiformis TaxID=82378 RepID=UPI003B20FD40
MENMLNFIIKTIVLVFVISLTYFYTIKASHVKPSGQYYHRGDFVIAGIFDNLHNEGCSGTDNKGLDTLQRIEAMVFAIDTVNKRNDILDNVTLGYDIIYTCGSWTTAMALTLTKLMEYGQCTNSEDSGIRNDANLLGVIGAEWSSITTKICPLYNTLHLPTLSVLSSSDELSDTENFPYFLRLVPPDRYQIQAIIDIVENFNWTSVSFVYTDDSYGRNAMKSFKNSNHSICIAEEYGISKNTRDSMYDEIVRKILSHDNSRVVILFTHEPYARKFLQAMTKLKAFGKLQLIGSDGWAVGVGDIKEYLNVTSGMIKLRFVDEPVMAFQRYFDNTINSTSESGNPWLTEFASDTALINTASETKVSNIMDGVLTYAYALESLIGRQCTEQSRQCIEQVKETFDGTNLFEIMIKLNFRGYNRHNVSFDSSGEVEGKYSVVNLQCNDQCQFAEIGSWNSSSGLTVFEDSTLSWGVGRAGDKPPYSYCEGPPTYIEWNNVIAIVLLCLTSIGLICTIIIAICYAINIKHDLIRVSGPGISYLVLFGVFISYLNVFAFIAKPSVVTCYLTRIGYMLCFTTVIAPLLVHANTIFRRYRSARRATRIAGPNCHDFTNQCSEIFLSMNLIFVQVLITITFLIATPPGTEVVETIPRQRELTCNKNDTELAISLTYNVLLIIACSIHAFLTRNFPKNFNESRFIGFSVYTTLVIWLSFIPAYIKVPFADLKVLVLSAAMIINASIILIFQFVVKLYAVLYVKTDLNISIRKKPTEKSWPSEGTRSRVRSVHLSRANNLHSGGEIAASESVNNNLHPRRNIRIYPLHFQVSEDTPAGPQHHGNPITVSADVCPPQSLTSDNPFHSFVSTWL